MKTESTLSDRVKEPGFWRELWQQARLVFYLLRDPEVPFYLKLLPFVAFAYILFPFDLVADFAPFIGQLDDVTALLVTSKVFIELAPPEVVARHLAMIRKQDGFVGDTDAPADDVADAIVIEGEHQVVNKDQA